MLTLRPAGGCHSTTRPSSALAPQDPFNPNLRVPNPELGYPGGPFDPLGFSKGNFKEAQVGGQAVGGGPSGARRGSFKEAQVGGMAGEGHTECGTM